MSAESWSILSSQMYSNRVAKVPRDNNYGRHIGAKNCNPIIAKDKQDKRERILRFWRRQQRDLSEEIRLTEGTRIHQFQTDAVGMAEFCP